MRDKEIRRGDLHESPLDKLLSFAVLIDAMIPALLGVSSGTGLHDRGVRSVRGETYRKPMLMATPTPAFSFFFICNSQMMAHGSRARMKSHAAEYPRRKCVSRRLGVAMAGDL